MSSFAYELGRVAANRRHAEKREQVEPLLGGDFLAEWRRGYGGEGLPCLKTTSDSPAGTAASRSREPESVPAVTGTTSASPTATKPQSVKPKQATLFDTGEPANPPRERTQTGMRPKTPTPVPLADVDQEIAALVAIGIGLSEADELVRKGQWTLDQLVCQWQIGNEAGVPQHVIGRVAKYGQQKWGERQR